MTKAITNLQDFRSYIRTLSDTELEKVGAQLEDEIKRKRDPARRLGHALFIDEVIIEKQMRANPLPDDIEAMTLDEIMAELDL